MRLLKRNPNPTREDIRHALKDTLCRYTGYPTIENAILAAAQSMQTGEPIAPPKIQLSAEKYQVIGQSVIRPDAEDKVTGKAKYSDDLKFDGMLYAAVKPLESHMASCEDWMSAKRKHCPALKQF